MSTKAKVVDADFATSAVPAANRRSLLTNPHAGGEEGEAQHNHEHGQHAAAVGSGNR